MGPLDTISVSALICPPIGTSGEAGPPGRVPAGRVYGSGFVGHGEQVHEWFMMFSSTYDMICGLGSCRIVAVACE